MTQSTQKNYMIFAIFICCSIVGAFLQTALTVAIPKIMVEFKVTPSLVQWLTSGYSLAMGVMIPATAYLMKRFKTRHLLLTGISLYLIGLGLAALSVHFSMLLLGRIIQALGAGLTVSLTQVIIIAIFPLHKRGTAMGIYGLAVGVAPVIAPILSGIVVDAYSWRLIFIVSLILMGINLIFAIKVMDNILPNEWLAFDIQSFLMSAIGFSALLIGLGNLGDANLGQVKVFLPLVIGLLSLTTFALRQLNLDKPFLELRTFQNKDFRLAVIMSMILYMVMIATTTMMPLYLQNIKGFTATASGFIMLPGSILMALVSPIAGKMYDKYGMKILSLVGSGLMFIGCIGFSFVNETTPLVYIILVYAVRVFSISCLLMPLVTWGLSNLRPDYTSHGSALLTTLRTVAGAMSAAVFVGVMSLVSKGEPNVINAISAKGIDVAFMGMSVLALIQLLLAVFSVKSDPKEKLIDILE